MEAKKTKKADLQNKRLLFLEIGLVVALGAVIFLFSHGRTERNINRELMVVLPVEFPGELPPPTREEVKVRQVPMPDINFDRINIRENNARIELGADIFINPETEIYIPVVKAKEKPVEDEIYLNVQDMPKFMGGGLGEFRSWVMKALVYPERAAETDMQGKVVVEFVVEKDGSVSGMNVLQTPDRILSDEVLRVLAVSPKWTPGMQGTKPARVKFTMPVDFVLR